MAAKLKRTKAPGIYRRGGRYALCYRTADGARSGRAPARYGE
jgi:hypothetical protein